MKKIWEKINYRWERIIFWRKSVRTNWEVQVAKNYRKGMRLYIEDELGRAERSLLKAAKFAKNGCYPSFELELLAVKISHIKRKLKDYK